MAGFGSSARRIRRPPFPRKAIFLEIFEISGDYIELNKLLKASGLCDTGGMAKRVIVDGQVEVNETVEYRIRRKIRNGQTVTFNGRTVGVGQGSTAPEKRE